MTVTIFGATGIVGRQLVRQAILQGFSVKAFGRDILTAGIVENDRLQLIPGAVFDAGQVKDAIKGSEAVLSALGGAHNMVDRTRSLGMKQIVTQMETLGVKRIVAVGNFGLLDNEEDDAIMNSPVYPAELLAVAKEHYKAYEHLKNSSLEWTLVCPHDIVDGDASGIYNTAAEQLPSPDNGSIRSGDLAAFMVKELKKNEYIKKRVGISN